MEGNAKFEAQRRVTETHDLKRSAKRPLQKDEAFRYFNQAGRQRRIKKSMEELVTEETKKSESL